LSIVKRRIAYGKLEKAKEKGFPKGVRWDVADIELDMSYLDWHGKRKK
jgi:hypothetical protein